MAEKFHTDANGTPSFHDLIMPHSAIARQTSTIAESRFIEQGVGDLSKVLCRCRKEVCILSARSEGITTKDTGLYSGHTREEVREIESL
jgi:hypothetical protein